MSSTPEASGAEVIARETREVLAPPHHGSRLAPVAVARVDRLIDGPEPGQRLFLRNKRAAGTCGHGPDRTLLMVHGTTFPSSAVFDFACDGFSWMDHLARHGFDVFALDLRGYGGSPWPPAPVDGPVCDTEAAIADVGAAIDFIRRERGIEGLSLLGWSWGTTLMGATAARRPAAVRRLVLYAPQWLDAEVYAALACRVPERERRVEEGAMRAAREADRAAGGAARLIPDAWFEAWLDLAFAADIGGASPDRTLTTPTGSLDDMRRLWSRGIAPYDPRAITAPTLVVHGDRDEDLPPRMAAAFFAELTGAASRLRVEIGEGGHDLFMETHRLRLFSVVLEFLLGL